MSSEFVWTKTDVYIALYGSAIEHSLQKREKLSIVPNFGSTSRMLLHPFSRMYEKAMNRLDRQLKISAPLTFGKTPTNTSETMHSNDSSTYARLLVQKNSAEISLEGTAGSATHPTIGFSIVRRAILLPQSAGEGGLAKRGRMRAAPEEKR